MVELRLLGDVCKTTSGGTPSRSKPHYFKGNIPWIKSGELPDGIVVENSEYISDEAISNSSAKLLPAGTLLVALYGATIGKLGILSRPAATNQAVCAISPSDAINTKFLFWYLLAKRPWLIGQAAGGAQPNISQGVVRSLLVPVMPLAEQYAIVAEIEKQFSRLDEAVANLQRVKANLKRYTDSVYAEVFGEEPNCTLGDLIEDGPQNGLYLPKEMYGEGVPILRIDDYQTAWIRPLAELRRVKATPDQIATWALRNGNLVINRVNSMTHLGKCVLIPAALAGTVFESNMMRMQLKKDVLPKYVEHYLASRLGKSRLTKNAKWAVNQASINQKDVQATPIFLPDEPVQQVIVSDVDRRLSIIKETVIAVDANLKRAQALRQATLAKAFLSKSNTGVSP